MNIQINEDIFKKITPRETQIALLFADGWTAKEIAHKLHIKTDTVEAHRQSIIKKAGAKNTPQAVANLIRGGII